MTTFTTNQWAILALVLVLGWLLGLLSRSGGRKWRRAYESERSDHLALQSAADARIAAANARITELERVTPVATGLGGGVAAMGGRDDLTLIHGIGRSGESSLNDLGIHTYADITGLSAADEAALESRLGTEPGTIARERWREQAEMLSSGHFDEHRRLYS